MKLQPKPCYSTGEVARILHFSHRTIAKYADRGMLRCWLIPGTMGRQHRRINHRHLVAFAVKYGIPLPEGFAPQPEKEQDSVPA